MREPPGRARLDPAANWLTGHYGIGVRSRHTGAEYEAGYEPCGVEQIPLQDDSGIERFQRREVLPYAVAAWYVRTVEPADGARAHGSRQVSACTAGDMRNTALCGSGLY